ncbi:minichromosome maintenance complex-binding protein [Tanacetum coccineum]
MMIAYSTKAVAGESFGKWLLKGGFRCHVFHCLVHIKLSVNDTILISPTTELIPDLLRRIRKSMLRHVTVVLGDDELAANFMLLHLSSKSTRAFIAATKYGSATRVPSSVLSRGVAWLGIGILMDGMWGTGTGSTASVYKINLTSFYFINNFFFFSLVPGQSPNRPLDG